MPCLHIGFELVAVEPGLVDLLDCELDSLLVLHAEIGAWPRHGKQTTDLDYLVLRVGDSRGGTKGEGRGGNAGAAWQAMLCHETLPQSLGHLSLKRARVPAKVHSVIPGPSAARETRNP